MATIDEIAELRLNIKEPANDLPYTDDFLSGMIDSYGVAGASGRIWRSKAATVANLVDTSEGGSSRKMSQLFTNYSAIAAEYESQDAVDDPATGFYAPRSRKAVRV